MKIGIIGAGRVGCSLGKYLRDKGITLTGYYDTRITAANEAAEFTQTTVYTDLQKLVSDSGILFITTTDAQIIPVWEQIKKLSLKNQIICHCSGTLSSDSFSGIEDTQAACCSVHPMLPFSNRFSSYQQLDHAFFTVEGQPFAVQVLTELLTSLGNGVCTITAGSKPRYHAAASLLSNHVIAVLHSGYCLLEECGFSRDEAIHATAALVRGNIDHVIKQGCTNALTGPIERNDTITVQKHLDCLDADTAVLYRELGNVLVSLSMEKHPGQNFEKMKKILKYGKKD